MAPVENSAKLHAIQHDVDDIRSLTLCKVCLRPFYEPFMLACGHTFCYGCLRNWFCGSVSRRKSKNCPECRTTIKATPAPNYSLRDLAHMFLDRPELLPEDETLAEHQAGRSEEARLLSKDRQEKGVFQGVFQRHNSIFGRGAILDQDDNVERCPNCNWEIEEAGRCHHCEWRDDEYDFSDEDSVEQPVDMDEDDFDEDADIDSEIGIPHLPSDDERYYGNYSRYGYSEEDDMISFISDDDDNPDEVDYDTHDWARPREGAETVGSGIHGISGPEDFVPFSDPEYDTESQANSHIHGGPADGSSSDEGVDNESMSIGGMHREPQNSGRRPQPFDSGDDDGTGNDQPTDYGTNYDDESSVDQTRSSTPVRASFRAPIRRTHIVVSDDDDDDNDEDGEDEPVHRNFRYNHTDDSEQLSIDTSGDESETIANDLESEMNADVDGESDDSMPPQSAADRRNRLQLRRSAQARRSTSNEQRGIHPVTGLNFSSTTASANGPRSRGHRPSTRVH